LDWSPLSDDSFDDKVVAKGIAAGADSRADVLRLYSVNEDFGVQVENRPAFNRFMLIPMNAVFIVFNQWSISQAGRRGFDSRLPLHFS
jgi:hypothetical protein